MSNRLAGIVCLTLFAGSAFADPIVLVPRQSAWRFLPATEDPPPDVSAWRQPNFDDSGWELLSGPFGYTDGPFGTDLSEREPPMRGSYTGVFLRSAFLVESIDELFELHVNADYDDGFAVWINGSLVIRENIRGVEDDPVNFETRAARGRESGEYSTFVIEDPQSHLVVGRNVIAVQGLNVSQTSNDFKIDIELVDPFGPDETAPSLVFTTPGRNTTVRSLSAIELEFDEAVEGVEASDLLVNGNPAVSVEGSGAGPYVFTLDAVDPGAVAVTWAKDHDIHDLARARNLFIPEAWTYTVDPDAPPPSLVINEILVSNLTLPLIRGGATDDWIEIFNAGDEPADLGGWSISDDSSRPTKWVFPNHVLAPREFLVVVASGANRREPDEDGRLHTSFRLSLDGEFLGLYSSNLPRELVSSFDPSYPPQRGDISYGVTAENALAYFETPSPGEANSGGSAFGGLTREPRASHDRGFYTAPFELVLSSPTPEAVIRYTLDGSEPSATVGSQYEGPITIQGSTRRGGGVVVRALAHRDGYLPSRVSTFSYFFPEQVLTQPVNPSGWPTVWGNSQTISADYQMDPQILSDDDNVGRALEGLVSIPTLSVALRPEDFLGRTTGIYANAGRSGLQWERACSAELILGDGKEGFQIDCGIRIQGGSSTQNWKSPKLSMRLLFKGDYGESKLRFPLFPDWDVSRFDTLVLDAGLNLVLGHPSHSQRVRLQYVRDQFVSDLQIEAGGLAPQGRFVNLYINGLYWGLFGVHEKPDASFHSEHYGGEKSEWDALRHSGSQPVDGNSQAWNTMITAARSVGSDAGRLVALEEHLDLSGHADYMICNQYAGNTDWAHHNWYAGRRRLPGEPFRFVSWDAEHVLKSATENVTSRNDGNSPTEIFMRLRANSEYRLLFADRAERHLSEGGMLWVNPDNRRWNAETPEDNRPASLYMKRIQEIDTAILLECVRWGDHYPERANNPYTRDREWMTELNWLLNSYFPVRSQYLRNSLNSLRLLSPVPPASFDVAAGDVASGTPLTLRAGEGRIFFTLDGSDPRVRITGEVAPTAIEYLGQIALELPRLQVRARVLNGDQWSTITQRTFYVPERIDDLRITEIHYNPTGSEPVDFVELRNVGELPFDLGGVRATRGIDYEFDTTALLQAGEMLVLVANAEAFSRAYPGVSVHGEFGSSLANDGERLRFKYPDGRTILDVEYDDDGLWPLSPDGFGFSLVFERPDADSRDPESWRASTRVGGSPGAVDPSPEVSGVVISEVLSRSTEPLEDAIELANLTAHDIDISGWFLSDSRDSLSSLQKFRIPDGTVVSAGAHVVIYERDFNASPGGPTSFALGSDGDQVYLSSSNEFRDFTGYLVGLRFRAADEGVSFGRVRTSAGVDIAPLRRRTFGSDAPENIDEFRAGNGEANSGAAVGPIVINEIHYHPADGDHEFVELYNLGSDAMPLFDSATGRGWQLRGLSGRGLDVSFEFPEGAVAPAGGYLLIVASDPLFHRERFSIDDASPIVGPSGGSLDNGGERLSLLKPSDRQPDDPAAPTAYVLVDQVRYDDGDRFPREADGAGPSLERVFAARHGNEPESWTASNSAGGTPGARNSVSPAPGNIPPLAEFVAAPAAGVAPVDARFDATLSRDVDGSIAAFDWDFGDGTQGEGASVEHRYESPGAFVVSLHVTDNDGAIDCYRSLLVVESVDAGGGVLPGDNNVDGRVTIADAVWLLNRLFRGAAGLPLPCEGDMGSPGNQKLLDINDDRGVNLTDAVHLLGYLFLGGPPPALGTSCLGVKGCPQDCAM